MDRGRRHATHRNQWSQRQADQAPAVQPLFVPPETRPGNQDFLQQCLQLSYSWQGRALGYHLPARYLPQPDPIMMNLMPFLQMAPPLPTPIPEPQPPSQAFLYRPCSLPVCDVTRPPPALPQSSSACPYLCIAGQWYELYQSVAWHEQIQQSGSDLYDPHTPYSARCCTHCWRYYTGEGDTRPTLHEGRLKCLGCVNKQDPHHRRETIIFYAALDMYTYPNTEAECPICLEPKVWEEKKGVALTCGHGLCRTCWVKTKRMCPLCAKKRDERTPMTLHMYWMAHTMHIVREQRKLVRAMLEHLDSGRCQDCCLKIATRHVHFCTGCPPKMYCKACLLAHSGNGHQPIPYFPEVFEALQSADSPEAFVLQQPLN
ncbi:unnamed protein product, partial [Mesorhabditis spiculigera]